MIKLGNTKYDTFEAKPVIATNLIFFLCTFDLTLTFFIRCIYFFFKV